MPFRRKKLTRRTLVIGGGLAGCVVLGVAAPGGYVILRNTVPGLNEASNVGKVDLQTPLHIPDELAAGATPSGAGPLALTLQTGETELLPDTSTDTWGANGTYLGPTLRMTRGQEVRMQATNDLPEDTSLHWHGMHLPAAMDGGPHQMIAKGETWEPHWTVDQPASTLWYHPHPHGQTAQHVYRGVAGMIIVDDDVSTSVRIPREYGVDDVPLIVQDKMFDGGEMKEEQGFLDQLSGSGSFGVLGDDILVNGTYSPRFDVRRSLTRFRVLNASNARFYNVGFVDGRPFRLLATDNGFAPGAPELDRLQLGPGERAEIVVEFASGDDVVLRSYPQNLGTHSMTESMIGGNDTFDILRCVAGDDLEASEPLELPDVEPGPMDTDGLKTRTFSLDGHSSINGQKMDMQRIDLAIPAEATEVWEVRSNGQPHTFHVHGATFHVLDVNGGEPPETMRGPKDTVQIGPETPVRFRVQFDDQVDPDMPYMYHCHLLRHEDNGMMGQFVVVEPGTEGDTPMTLEMPDHHH